MKGYYKRKNKSVRLKAATVYSCNHMIYSKATLFKLGEFGLCVIQQRYNPEMKVTWWGPIDPWLANDICEEKLLDDFLSKHARVEEDGMYPTIEVRKLMHALHMKPMKKEIWETSFRSLFL